MMETGALTWDEKIYPREKKSEKTVDTYCEALNAGAEFPPIEIQRVTNYPDKEGETFIILDGFHRWEAYKRNKAAEIGIKEWIPEAIDYKQSQIILLLEAAERNSRHGDRLAENDKKRTARRIAEADRKKIYTEEQIAEKLSVSRRTVSDWISDIRSRQNADRNSKIICLSRLARTQEEIADAVGTTQGRVAQIINNGEFAKINNFLEQGRDMAWIAEHYNIDIPLAWALRLEGKTDQERFQELGWGLRTWDQWSFNECDERFGDDWPGRIPAQLIGHTLFYFTEKGNLVLDPMAGGGVVPDTCLLFERRCRAFDMAPSEDRPEIQKHYWNIDRPDWPNMKKPDLILFDPPYFTKKEREYKEKADANEPPLSSFDRELYLNFLSEFFSLAYENSKPTARLAFLNADWRDFQSTPAVKEDPSNSITIFDYQALISRVGWHITHRIECPMSTERFSGNMVSSMQEARILGTVGRTLLIGKK